MSNTCEQCSYFDPHGNQHGTGDCLRHSPVTHEDSKFLGGLKGTFPIMCRGDYCGDFMPKDPVKFELDEKSIRAKHLLDSLYTKPRQVTKLFVSSSPLLNLIYPSLPKDIDGKAIDWTYEKEEIVGVYESPGIIYEVRLLGKARPKEEPKVNTVYDPTNDRAEEREEIKDGPVPGDVEVKFTEDEKDETRVQEAKDKACWQEWLEIIRGLYGHLPKFINNNSVEWEIRDYGNEIGGTVYAKEGYRFGILIANMKQARHGKDEE